MNYVHTHTHTHTHTQSVITIGKKLVFCVRDRLKIAKHLLLCLYQYGQ